MPDSVVDASVLAAVAYAEDNEPEAAALLEGNQLYAPHLLAFELANIARSKAVAQPELLESLLLALGRTLETAINWTEVDYVATVDLAIDQRLSTYGASYLHLALVMGVPLLTFDQRLKRAAVAVGVEAP